MNAEASPPQFWVKHLTVKNFRCFEKLTIDLDKQLTVLIARNGAGKTALLDALVVSVGTFVGSFYTGKGKGIHSQDVRMSVIQKEPFRMAPQYPAIISAEGEIDGRVLRWKRQLNTLKSKTTIKDAQQITDFGKELQKSVSQGSKITLPLIAYYGTARLWRQKKITFNKSTAISFELRTTGYLDCIDPESSYSYFKEWFIYYSKAVEEARNQENEEGNVASQHDDNGYSSLLRAVKRAVNTCLSISGWRNIRYSFIRKSIVMKHAEHGILKVEQLSDGVRNMVAMAADIAFRMAQLNAHEGENAVRNTPGLILIDEVDMHLHPEWQQIILASLTRAFPKVQFVVTTHSPQVISTVPRTNVRVIAENLDGRFVASMPLAETYGRSNSDVMQAVMGVSPEPENENTEALRRYLSLVEQSDAKSPELTAQREELERIFGGDHPLLIRAGMITRRKEALNR